MELFKEQVVSWFEQAFRYGFFCKWFEKLFVGRKLSPFASQMQVE
jgi:hypothetical protein